MLMRPPTISTGLFNYHAETRTFSEEASTLEGNGWRLGQVYDDACDEGFTLVSTRTGREIVCVLSHIEKDKDGDIRWWEYVPATTIPHRPDVACPFKVIVWND